MAGKTPKEAVSNFLDPLSLVVSCFTKSVLRHGGGYDLGELCALAIGEDGRFKPKSQDGNIILSILMQYKIVKVDGDRGPYKVKTASYFYAIENRNQQELVAYHWHPEGTDIPFPHI
ncbi:MAG TPA: hypothetical protein PLX97_15520, partial [Gemmatales bacterium]|nr:hypothetical protein [Gemmatales bacterium]